MPQIVSFTNRQPPDALADSTYPNDIDSNWFQLQPTKGTCYTSDPVSVPERTSEPRRLDDFDGHDYMSSLLRCDEGLSVDDYSTPRPHDRNSFKNTPSECVSLRSMIADSIHSIRRSSHRRPDQGKPATYMDLGACEFECQHCHAFFWSGERLKGVNHAAHPEYHLCCGGGKIYMPVTPDPPVFIRRLLDNSHFMGHIRAYNQMFAMTSFGAKVDDSVNRRKGPYVFKISGQIYHWIGSLCPEIGNHHRFLQLYIYDTHNELNNRMRNFSSAEYTVLIPEIVDG